MTVYIINIKTMWLAKFLNLSLTFTINH